nr:Chain D, ADP-RIBOSYLATION FACTOR GTPASE-ACTIVATING PROTEIN GCS1 [Saccharomyces cerevisiae]5FJX_E Chain E, ADP-RIBOSYLATION FACTOR GTPASE-ACTIVATING PROTEIN GCS1 [Saccharomyces cerevisiae]
DEDKWDDF